MFSLGMGYGGNGGGDVIGLLDEGYFIGLILNLSSVIGFNCF